MLHSLTPKYSAFTDKVELNCHFPPAGWNYSQALQGFTDNEASIAQ